MPTLRRSLAGTAVLVLLGGSGAVVAGQSEDAGPPGAASSESVFSGTYSGCEAIGDGTDVDGGWRDLGVQCQMLTTDPRVNGIYVVKHNYQEAGGGFINWGTSRLDGGDGGWECSFTGTADPYPASAEDQLTLVVCAGTGGYDGLTQIRYQGTVGGDGFGDGINIVGLIYEGDPPPPWGPSLSQ